MRQPDRIGKYLIRKIIDVGGMGEVYHAYDPDLDRSVAIKRIRADTVQTPEVRARFLREARIMGSLKHPSIVQIHELFEEKQNHFIVMELVQGQSLAAHLRAGPLPPADALSLLTDVAAGLAAAHDQGIVHRDLKAENVIVTADGDVAPRRAKILDFGLAKSFCGSQSSISHDHEIIGTPYCLSPEQIENRKVDHRCDLFSLGVLCYLALTGERPFSGSSLRDLLVNIAHRPHRSARERNPSLSAELSALIDRLLEKDPNRRPQSAAEVAAALARPAGILLRAPVGRQPLDADLWRTLPLNRESEAGASDPWRTLPLNRESQAESPPRRSTVSL